MAEGRCARRFVSAFSAAQRIHEGPNVGLSRNPTIPSYFVVVLERTRAKRVDRDMEIDLATANAPSDRLVVVATAPLTPGECWHALVPGELRVFAGGRAVWHGAAFAPVARELLAAA